ncbi:hypothetical protein [Candidatus Palauibacter sp.]|uniref:hypothetical protein n=1 Tax=Candidatus Palauibacter sp. TaxID=3101350 RepID=UPI003AF30749
MNGFPVKLGTEPTEDVTVTVGGASPPVGSIDTDLVTANDQNTLTFTKADYSTAQYVYVTITHDLNAASESVTLDLSAESDDDDYDGVTGQVTVKTADDDIGLTANVEFIDEDADSTAVVVTATAATAPTDADGLTIDLALAGVSGGVDGDFRAMMTGTENQIVIKKDETSAIDTVWVTAIDDANAESELGEQIEIRDDDRTDVNGLYVAPWRITINDADPDITLTVTRNSSIDEGADATSVEVTAALPDGVTAPEILTFTIGNVSVCSAVSASASGQTFTIDTGSSSGSGTVSVTPVANIDDDVDCDVTATVAPPAKTTGGVNWTIKDAALTIVNADDSES